MRKIQPSKLSGPVSLEMASHQGNLLEGVFSVRETGINNKIFHSWKNAGMLSTVPKGKWAKLSYVDYLWLRTLECMRQFGCSHKTMKDIHEELFTRAYKENLGEKTLEENVRFMSNLSKKRPLTSEEAAYLDATKVLLDDHLLLSTNLGITYFYQLVLKCFTNQTEVGLVIFEDGRFQSYELASNPEKEEKRIDLSAPHLLIPISYFIKQFIADEGKEHFLKPAGLLDDYEYEVLKQIRNRNIKSITITFNDTDHRIEKIESETTGLLKGEEAEKIKEFLALKNYSGIELNTRDGKNISFKRTQKMYMNK